MDEIHTSNILLKKHSHCCSWGQLANRLEGKGATAFPETSRRYLGAGELDTRLAHRLVLPTGETFPGVRSDNVESLMLWWAFTHIRRLNHVFQFFDNISTTRIDKRYFCLGSLLIERAPEVYKM